MPIAPYLMQWRALYQYHDKTAEIDKLATRLVALGVTNVLAFRLLPRPTVHTMVCIRDGVRLSEGHMLTLQHDLFDGALGPLGPLIDWPQMAAANLPAKRGGVCPHTHTRTLTNPGRIRVRL